MINHGLLYVNKSLCKMENVIKRNFIAKNSLQTGEAQPLVMNQKYAPKKQKEVFFFIYSKSFCPGAYTVP